MLRARTPRSGKCRRSSQTDVLGPQVRVELNELLLRDTGRTNSNCAKMRSEVSGKQGMMCGVATCCHTTIWVTSHHNVLRIGEVELQHLNAALHQVDLRPDKRDGCKARVNDCWKPD